MSIKTISLIYPALRDSKLQDDKPNKMLSGRTTVPKILDCDFQNDLA